MLLLMVMVMLMLFMLLKDDDGDGADIDVSGEADEKSSDADDCDDSSQKLINFHTLSFVKWVFWPRIGCCKKLVKISIFNIRPVAFSN